MLVAIVSKKQTLQCLHCLHLYILRSIYMYIFTIDHHMSCSNSREKSAEALFQRYQSLISFNFAKYIKWTQVGTAAEEANEKVCLGSRKRPRSEQSTRNFSSSTKRLYLSKALPFLLQAADEACGIVLRLLYI